MKLCPAPHCGKGQPCPDHARKPFQGATRSSELYKTARWKRERAAFLKANRRCVAPYLVGWKYQRCDEPATVVDHDPPHRGDEAAFWDRSTWRALCRYHSNVKTGKGL